MIILHILKIVLIKSTHSLQMNLFLITQITFNQDILIPNVNQIHLLRISNYFMFDKDAFALSSLNIIILGHMEFQSLIYQQIFRLPSSKYCQLSLGYENSRDLLPKAINE